MGYVPKPSTRKQTRSRTTRDQERCFRNDSNTQTHTQKHTHTYLQLALGRQLLSERPPALLCAGVYKGRPKAHDEVHKNRPLLGIEGTHLEALTCRWNQQ
jgi:hypothetical protein